MMSVDDSLTCSFQILKSSDKKGKFGIGNSTVRPGTPPHKVPKPFQGLNKLMEGRLKKIIIKN